ncbi:MAG: cyclic nucleotide-binding domain-containing protein [Bdellovibrio sp.]|nr:cyclic nucleotide-binding domain-containing protein [Bdellovibrio sp.]
MKRAKKTSPKKSSKGMQTNRNKKRNKKIPVSKGRVDASLIKKVGMVALFKNLNKQSLATLLAKTEVKTFHKGEFVFHAGDASDAAYVNLQGVLRVENNGLFLSNVDEGECVGEMGVLNDWPRSADLIAMMESKVLFIPKMQFRKIMQQDQKAAITIYKNAVRILGTLIRNKNIVMEFSKILDDSVLAASSAEDLSQLKPNVE